MRKLIAFLLLISLIIACSPSKNISTGTTGNTTTVGTERDGSSYHKAIIIKEKNETKGIKAEYEWLRKNYPGYEAKKQALIVQKKTPYDVITIVTENGEEKSIYFDISNFYGKY